VNAWTIFELGEPRDVLRLVDGPRPDLHPGEVRVDVEAASLNFLDAAMCRGDYPVKPPLPMVIGSEFVGRIINAADGAELATGQRVVGMSPSAQGALAEEVVVPCYAVFDVPDSLPAATAATLLVTYQTAYFALHHRAKVQVDETVLVHAGAGGVGTAAIQLARAHGARVIATAGGPEKVALCREQGADHAIDSRAEDFVPAVVELTDGRGADVILDQVGGEVFTRSLECLAFEGRILPIGWASGTVPELSADRIVARNQDVLGLSWGSTYPQRQPQLVAAAHRRLLELHEQGAIRPVISEVAPFSDAPGAVQRLGDGRTAGKVVIAVN
jgi:NADPH2:quinone reductase